jgi:hypothetical protein
MASRLFPLHRPIALESASTLPPSHQVMEASPNVLSAILANEVNLAIWQRSLPSHIADFSALVLSLGQRLADERVVEVREDAPVVLNDLLVGTQDLQGYEAFVADVTWLVEAFTCLVGARRLGLRLRTLQGAMCPRFHVDHVALRLLTTYAGAGSEWLSDPADANVPERCHRLGQGNVALLKGENWSGNEGRGLVHRSPGATQDAGRLLLSIDWLQ